MTGGANSALDARRREETGKHSEASRIWLVQLTNVPLLYLWPEGEAGVFRGEGLDLKMNGGREKGAREDMGPLEECNRKGRVLSKKAGASARSRRKKKKKKKEDPVLPSLDTVYTLNSLYSRFQRQALAFVRLIGGPL